MAANRQLQQINAQEEKRQPLFIVRAKDGPNPKDWGTVGAAWDFKDGSPGFFVKLKSLPLQWDGTLVMLPPQQNGDESGTRREDEGQ